MFWMLAKDNGVTVLPSANKVTLIVFTPVPPVMRSELFSVFTKLPAPLEANPASNTLYPPVPKSTLVSGVNALKVI